MSEKIPKRYVPDSLTEKQKKKQIESIKKGVDRPKLKGVKTRKSKWTVMAHKYFGESPSLQDIKKKLGLKSITGLKKIIEKGEGAYYSSGSRPNVSAEQWGRARLYSVLFGGKSRNIDKEIVEKYNIPLITLESKNKGILSLEGHTPQNKELKGGDVSNLKNKEDVEDAKEYALSDKDLKNLIPKTNIFTYPELENIRHIDEVFKKNKNGVETAIMLYLTDSHNMGHWIGLIKKGNTIEFFDPYGQELKKVGKFLGGKMQKYQDPQLLKDKIKEAGYKLIENDKKHQPVSDDINTCGRHTALRIMFGHLSLDEYNKLMNEIKKKHNLNSDDLATFMTYDILDK